MILVLDNPRSLTAKSAGALEYIYCIFPESECVDMIIV